MNEGFVLLFNAEHDFAIVLQLNSYQHSQSKSWHEQSQWQDSWWFQWDQDLMP